MINCTNDQNKLMIKLGPYHISAEVGNETRNVTILGPVSSSGDVSIRSIRSFGPIEINGNLEADFIRSFGPFTAGKDIDVTNLKVNGPATIGNNANTGTVKVNGPLLVSNMITDHILSVNGPVKANSLTADIINLKGTVDVKGTIEASYRVVISINSENLEIPIKAGLIKAPEVRISYLASTIFTSFFQRITKYDKEPMIMPIIDVPIEANHIILNRVKLIGKLDATNVTLLNGAEYRKLLE